MVVLTGAARRFTDGAGCGAVAPRPPLTLMKEKLGRTMGVYDRPRQSHGLRTAFLLLAIAFLLVGMVLMFS